MLLSDVCLTSLSICLSVLLSVAYIGPKSRTERPRKTKIGTEVAHVTRHNMPPPPASWQYLSIYSPGGNVLACWLFKTSARSWPLTFWPWKWCPTCDVGYLCANFSIGLYVLELGPIYATRQTDVRRRTDCQTKTSLNASALWGGGIMIKPADGGL